MTRSRCTERCVTVLKGDFTMRRSLRTVTLVVGTVAGTTSGAALLALGCGGDDSVSGVQEDGSSDSTVDVNPDSPLPDSAPTTEGGVDAGNGGDTGNRSDGDASSASDSTTITDSSDFADIGDVQIDVPSLAQFPLAVVSAFCGRLEQCCIRSQDIASASSVESRWRWRRWRPFGGQFRRLWCRRSRSRLEFGPRGS